MRVAAASMCSANLGSLARSSYAAAQETTRDYVLDLQGRNGEPALLNIFGGKITTYRHLAEEALKKLETRFPAMGGPWTRGAVLPGGDIDVGGFESLSLTNTLDASITIGTTGAFFSSSIKSVSAVSAFMGRGVLRPDI